MIGVWLIVGAALASGDCAGPFSAQSLRTAMDRVDEALSVGDPEGARPDLLQAHRGALCLDAAASPDDVGRLARLFALAFFFDQDEESVRRWGLLSRFAGDAAWDADRFPPGHPFRDMLEDAEDPGLGGHTDHGFAIPKGAAVLLNGLPLQQPSAPVEVPGLLQVVGARGEVVEAWWIDGSAFPEHLLGPPVAPARPTRAAKADRPKRGKGKRGEPGVAVAAVAPAPPAGPRPDPGAASSTAAAARPADAPVPQETVRTTATTIAVERTFTAEGAPVTPGAYVDPFTDARRRALARSVSERALVGPEGAVGVVRTEVITFVSDPSGGGVVTQRHFADWLVEYDEWAPGGQMARRAGDGYLAGWTGTTPPAPDQPVTGVSYLAAQAYCGSWGNRVATLDQEHDGATREWRRSGDTAVVLEPGGASGPTDPKQTPEDVAFRCAP